MKLEMSSDEEISLGSCLYIYIQRYEKIYRLVLWWTRKIRITNREILDQFHIFPFNSFSICDAFKVNIHVDSNRINIIFRYNLIGFISSNYNIHHPHTLRCHDILFISIVTLNPQEINRSKNFFHTNSRCLSQGNKKYMF